MAYNAETGDMEPDQCQYSTKSFTSARHNTAAVKRIMAKAAEYACQHNCYGSEGFLIVQEWTQEFGWDDRERWLCQDGKVIERVDTGY